MKRFTTYNTDTLQAVAEGKRWPGPSAGVPPPNMDANLVLLEEIDGANPPLDTATQKLGSYGDRVYDLAAETATRSRSVIDLTQEELDARAEQAAHDAGANTANWIATLNAGGATNAQVQKALAWTIRQLMGRQ